MLPLTGVEFNSSTKLFPPELKSFCSFSVCSRIYKRAFKRSFCAVDFSEAVWYNERSCQSICYMYPEEHVTTHSKTPHSSCVLFHFLALQKGSKSRSFDKNLTFTSWTTESLKAQTCVSSEGLHTCATIKAWVHETEILHCENKGRSCYIKNNTCSIRPPSR